MILHVDVVNKIATLKKRGGRIVCDNSDYQIKFSFDAEWNDYSEKTARFISNGHYTDVDFTGNFCDVPVLHDTNKVEVGVYAGDLKTTTRATIECYRSILCDDQTPTEENDRNYANDAKEAADRAEAAAKIAEEGIQGPQGIGIAKIEKTSTVGLVDTYTITLTDGRISTFTVKNGQDGEDGSDGVDGISPVISISKEDGVTTITITDATGTKTVQIVDGKDGQEASVELDTNLTEAGKAADAKAVGDAIAELDQTTREAVQDCLKQISDLKSDCETHESIYEEIVDELTERVETLENAPAGASVELDTDLTQEGKAADAKAVGDRLTAVETEQAEESGRLDDLEQAHAQTVDELNSLKRTDSEQYLELSGILTNVNLQANQNAGDIESLIGRVEVLEANSSAVGDAITEINNEIDGLPESMLQAQNDIIGLTTRMGAVEQKAATNEQNQVEGFQDVNNRLDNLNSQVTQNDEDIEELINRVEVLENTPDASVELDDTLQDEGKAADAKAVGTAIANLQQEMVEADQSINKNISDLNTTLSNLSLQVVQNDDDIEELINRVDVLESEAYKAEIVNAVIAALPVYNGEVESV